MCRNPSGPASPLGLDLSDSGENDWLDDTFAGAGAGAGAGPGTGVGVQVRSQRKKEVKKTVQIETSLHLVFSAPSQQLDFHVLIRNGLLN